MHLFLTTSFYTASLSLLNQQEQVLMYQSLTYLLYIKLAKLTFLANVDVSTTATFFKSAFIALLDKCNSNFTFFPKGLSSGKY